MIKIPEKQDPEQIKKIAMDLDEAIESMKVEDVIPFFADDCEIHMMDIVLKGVDGVRKWHEWLFSRVAEISFEPIVIIVQDNVFFEEFNVRALLPDGRLIKSKQAEVLIYEDYKIKSLRLYFDRLDFAESITRGLFVKKLIKKIKKQSLKGLL